MKLYDYQQELVNKINKSKDLRNCVQLPTGGGKTVIFSHLANTNKGNVLILVNRAELLVQTTKNIKRSISLITSKTKIIGVGKVKIGMVESVYNRIKKGSFSLKDIDLLIVDEIQNLQFTKIFENYTGRLLGFSATPVIMKKENYFKCKYCEKKTEKQTICCGKENQKYTKELSLKQWYGNLIVGKNIEFLIDAGKLTQVHNFISDTKNLNKLKTDNSDEFSAKIQNEVFNNLSNINNLYENYLKHAKGKKTMVFNTNIESNNEAFKKFKNMGLNVYSYDSKSKTNRKEIVEKFRKEKDAILMSVGVFTTGFDVDDVECIILNKATKSLSLYHQIVGRGGRITDKIYKPFFKLIDLGGNVNRFGSWSRDIDWFELYNNESEKKTRKKDIEDFIVCTGCMAMIKAYDCEFCGQKKIIKKSKGKVKIAEEINPLPPPNAKHILNYCLKNDLNINQGKILTANYLVDMLIFSKTPKIKNIDYLRVRIKKVITPIYFALHKSKLIGNRKRTIDDFVNKCSLKIKNYYENRS